MNPPNWRIEDGLLLQQLRQNAKIDDFVFARMNAISLAQLRELEGQGEGSFYNAQIKTNTGLKLLRKLGHEPVFEFPVSASAPQPIGATAAVSDPIVSTPSLSTASHDLARRPSADAPALARSSIGLQPKWAAGLLLAGGLVWSASRMPWPEFTTLFGRDPASAAAPAAAQPLGAAPGSIASPTAAESATDVSAPATPSTNEVTGTSAAAAAGHHPAAACDWRHQQTSANYEPTDPIKAGNYIHFVATQDVSLCVRDQQNQLTDLQLKAGSAQSVYGDPPFLVHSANWPHLQIFYQGRRVMSTPEGASYWVFKNKVL